MFGGNFEEQREKRKGKHCLLKKLKINYEVEEGTNRMMPKDAALKGSGHQVLFKGNPAFSQLIPNKVYLEKSKTWVFIDKTGRIYFYDTVMQSTDYFNTKTVF